jgi:hypothetical protein
MRALIALALTLLLSRIAAAEDWRYCLAPSHADHKIYVSTPFPATMSMDAAESQFGRALTHSGLRYDDVHAHKATANRVRSPCSGTQSASITNRESRSSTPVGSLAAKEQ